MERTLARYAHIDRTHNTPRLKPSCEAAMTENRLCVPVAWHFLIRLSRRGRVSIGEHIQVLGTTRTTNGYTKVNLFAMHNTGSIG